MAWIVGCTPSTIQPTEQESDPYPFIQGNGTADEADEGHKPYPFQSTPSGSEATPRPILFSEIPSPSPDSGVVTGILLQPGEKKDPYLAEIYLGRAIEAQQPGFDPIIGFSRETDPVAVQNQETGEFYFSDIPPGKYGLIIWNPINSYIFKNEKNEGFLILEVEAGSISDLGELRMP